MALWAVGVVINLVGSVMINLGTNIIKLGHTKTAAALTDDEKAPKLTRTPQSWWHFPGNRIWLGGMLLFSVGNLLNFASFAFAAQSLLSALGTVQFISNILFGRYVNREKVTRRVLLATATVCAGCVLLVVFGNHDSPTLSALDMLELYTKPLYIVYLCFIFTASPAMYLLYRAGKRAILADRSGGAARAWARWLPICYALFAGLVGTQSVLFGKTISMLLRTSFTGDSQLGSWYTWVSLVLFVLFAGFWMSRYSKAMKLFPVLIIMPVIQIVWILFSMISGSLYFQEYRALGPLSGSMFGLGVLILLAGVWLLTGGGAAMAQPPPAKEQLEASELQCVRVGSDMEALSDGPAAGEGGPGGGAAGQLEPEEQLVARRLSSVYERQGGAGGGSVRLGGGVGGRRGRDSAGDESHEQLVGQGAADSAAWPAGSSQPPGHASSRGGADVAASGRGGTAAAHDLSAAAGAASAPLGRAGSAAAAPAPEPAGSPPPPSLMHDLRADWGVGVREVAALVRASVGLGGAGDAEDPAAFSTLSMPMPLSASFTHARRSLDAQRPTFHVRAAMEAAVGGSVQGGSVQGGARQGRPGHRRLNRSRSANELPDEVLMGLSLEAAPGGDMELEGGVPQHQPAPSGGVEPPWHASSGSATAAAGYATQPLVVPSPRPPSPPPALRLHPSGGSVPALGAAHGSRTPPAGATPVRMLSSGGSVPRRPWSPAALGGDPTSPPPALGRSPLSEAGESDGPGSMPFSLQEDRKPAARKGDKAA